MQLRYYKELDGIRGLAAIMVLLFHYINGQQYSGNLFQIVKKVSLLGQTGVSLFFVLSGFLITRILIQQKYQSSYFKYFYYRRALRIFPLYFLFIFIYFISLNLFNHSTNVNSILYCLVYIQNIAMTFNWTFYGPEHLWSLAVEEHFYIIWPLFIYFGKIKHTSKIALGMILLSILFRIYFLQQNLETFYFTLSRLDELCFGSLLALKEIRQKNSNSPFKFTKSTYIIFSLIFLVSIYFWFILSGKSNFVVQIFKFTFLGYIYFIFIGAIIQLDFDNWFKKIFLSKFLIFSGGISYGLYIFHPLCFLLINEIANLHWMIKILTSFLLTYLVAFLSYNYFEHRFILLKNKIVN